MPRNVRHDASGPIKLEPHQFPRDAEGNLKPIWICACGVSRTMPFCDGTHKVCRAEEPGQVYEYDKSTMNVIRKTPDDRPPAAAPVAPQ